MRQVNLIFLILLCFEKTNMEMRLSQVSETSVSPDFMIKILRNHFGSLRKMTIFFSDRYTELTKLIRDIDVPVIVNAEEIPLPEGLDTREPSELVILVEDLLNLATYLNRILWTADTRFILIPTDSNIIHKELEEIFQVFQAANIVNVFIFVTTLEKVSIFTYKYFASKNCDAVEVFLLDVESQTFTLNNPVDNMNGCLLNASTINLPPMAIFQDDRSLNGTFILEGTEASIVKEVAKKLNFRTRFALAKDGGAWGWIHPSPYGVVGEVYRKQSQFGFGLLAPTMERFELLDVTVPVSPVWECVTWAVPLGAAKYRAAWIEIYLNEFSLGMFLSLIFFFGLASLIFWKISKVYGSVHFAEVTFFLFSIFINVPVKTPKQAPLKMLFITWIFYSFVLMISYQSYMGSKLTVPYPRPDIETINDLLESDLHFTGFNNTFRLIVTNQGNLKHVVSRLEPTLYGIEEAINYIVFDRNIAYMRETTSFKYYTIKNPKSRGKVHFMKECVYQYYPIMVLQRRSPLTKKTNEIITRLFESGLLMNWRKRYIYPIAQIPPSVIQLTVTHMLAPFVAFALGITISIIAYIYERLQIFFKGSKNIFNGFQRNNFN